MNILLHICCANCAIYPLKLLQEEGHDIIGFWFNPNIHPYIEYKNRLEAVKKLQNLWNNGNVKGRKKDLPVEYIDYYGLEKYLRNVVGSEDNRCEYCYTIRLEETARRAKDINADAFTTTLLVSPYQKFDMIVDIGKVVEDKYSVGFYVEDLRKGFYEGKGIAKGLGLYQQKYCGCIYSGMERYGKSFKKTRSFYEEKI